MSDAITHGELMKFLNKNHFIAKGKKQNRYVGILNRVPKIVTFHYHKSNDYIPIGALSAISKQLGMTRKDLINKIKHR